MPASSSKKKVKNEDTKKKNNNNNNNNNNAWFFKTRLVVIITVIVVATYNTHRKYDKINGEIDKLTKNINHIKSQIDSPQSSSLLEHTKQLHTSIPLTISHFQKIGTDTLIKLGQVFTYKKVAESLLADHIHGVPWNNDKDDDEEDGNELEKKYITGAGVDMLSLAISQNEIDNSTVTTENIYHGSKKLNELGAVLFQSAIPHHLCDEVAEYAHEKTVDAPESSFGQIMEADLRKDLPLSLNTKTMPILRHVLKLSREILEDKCGKDPLLVELSSLISYPGANAQNIHPDFWVDEATNHYDANIVSVFCYLVDVDENMAALDLLPGTQKLHFHLNEEADDVTKTATAVRLAVPKGSFVLMDSRTFHRGTDNTTPRSRPVFYFSVMERLKPIPEGPTYSIRSDIAEKNFTISTLLDYIDVELSAERLKEKEERENFYAPDSALMMKAPNKTKGGEKDNSTNELLSPYWSQYLETSLSSSYFNFKQDTVTELNTNNFEFEINRSKYTFACFFDPRSAAFRILKDQYRKAAKMAMKDTDRYGHVRFVAIDASRHSYLTENVAPMLVASQQQKDRQEFDLYQFGRSNYFPLIFIMFRDGEFLREYTGVVKEEDMLDFVYKQSQPDVVKVLDIDQEHLRTFFEHERVAFLRCGSAFNATLAGEEEDDIDMDETEETSSAIYDQERIPNSNLKFEWNVPLVTAYYKVAKELKGSITFASLDVDSSDNSDLIQEYCKKTKENVTKNNDVIVVYSYGKYMLSFHDTELNIINFASLERSIHYWVESIAHSVLVNELTPDNSHTFLDRMEPLMMLLVHKEEERVNGIVKNNMIQVAKRLGYANIQLAWADGKEFGNQFNIPPTKKSLPRIVLVSNVEHDGDDEDFHTRLLPKHLKLSKKNIYRYLQGGDIMKKYNESCTKILAEFLEDYDIYNSTKHENDDDDDDENIAATDTNNTNTNNSATKNKSGWFSLVAESNEKATISSSDDDDKKNLVVNDTNTDKAIAEPTKIEPNPGEILSNISGRLDKLGELYEYRLLQTAPEEDREFVKSEIDALTLYIEANFPLLKVLAKSPEELEVTLKDSLKTEDLKSKIVQMSTMDEAIQKYSTKSLKKLDQFLETKTEEMIKSLEAKLDRKQIAIDATGKEEGEKEEETSLINNMKDFPNYIPIDRIHWTNLSVETFFYEYARKKKPIVIEGLPISKVPWTLKHIKDVCGKLEVEVNMRDPNTTNWGGLVYGDTLNLADFIDTHATDPVRKKYYLHDWSLPGYCPDIMGKPPYDEYIMPKYFSGDYFQRVFPNGYQHSWPSLFIGAKGTQSDLHVDSGGTNFWLYLLSGKKEWRFFPREDQINLYKRTYSAKFEPDIFNPDFKKYPLLSKSNMYHTIQNPGDLVFIPGSCPHAVRNLDNIHGISMNYVDASNFYLHLYVLLQDRKFREFELFTNSNFKQGLSSQMENLPFGAFKSMDWNLVEMDLF